MATAIHTFVDHLDLSIAEMQETSQVTEVFDLSYHGKTLPQFTVTTTGVTVGNLRESRVNMLSGQSTYLLSSD